MSWLYQPLLAGGAQQQGAVSHSLEAASPAPGPLFLSPRAYRALQKRRRQAEDALEALRRADEDRRRALRAMIGRAIRGEPEPAPHAPPAAGETQPPAGLVRPVRMGVEPDPAAEADMARLAARIAALKDRIAAHERAEAEEEDDMEALLLLAA